MTWRLARALEKLRSQVNEAYPIRSKQSDGTKGDDAHASRASDHNPDKDGVVKALDLTHDPKGGFNSYDFADMLLLNKDPRIKYVISNRQIGSGSAGPSPWKWRKYTGANPHDHHCHISVKATKAQYDSVAGWKLDELPSPIETTYVAPPPTLRKGSTGDDVRRLQAELHIFIDGEFGPLTEAALKKFQTANKLVADGIAGPQVWKAIT